jgi:hypothetical protein
MPKLYEPDGEDLRRKLKLLELKVDRLETRIYGYRPVAIRSPYVPQQTGE